MFIWLSLFQKILQKQQKLDADPKAIQQINFTGNLSKEKGSTMFFVIDQAKETFLDFSKVAVKVLWFCFLVIQFKMTQYNTVNVKLSNS